MARTPSTSVGRLRIGLLIPTCLLNDLTEHPALAMEPRRETEAMQLTDTDVVLVTGGASGLGAATVESAWRPAPGR